MPRPPARSLNSGKQVTGEASVPASRTQLNDI